MKILTKILLFIAICNLFVSCGTTKNKRSAATKTTVKTVATEVIKANVTVETKHFGDTLKGSMPLPKLTEKPTNITIESGGQKLDLAISKNTLVYTSTPKHIATTTIHSVNETDTKAVADVEQVQEVKTVNIKEPWRPPWWWYLVGAATIYLIYSYYTNKFAPIKNLLKTILKTILTLFK